MKKTFVFVFVLISSTLLAQKESLSKGVEEKTNLYRNEIGWNFRNTASFLLGGQLHQPQFNLHYKRVNEKGNAMRYSLNVYRENPSFFPGVYGNTIDVTPTSKIEINSQRESTTALVGVGWEYRAPTHKAVQFYMGGDILLGYRMERRQSQKTTYKALSDSTLLAGSLSIYVPNYEIEYFELMEETITQSFVAGVRGMAGVIWKPFDRIWMTTSMESTLLQGFGNQTNRNFVANTQKTSEQSSSEFNNRLVADFSLYYRF